MNIDDAIGCKNERISAGGNASACKEGTQNAACASVKIILLIASIRINCLKSL